MCALLRGREDLTLLFLFLLAHFRPAGTLCGRDSGACRGRQAVPASPPIASPPATAGRNSIQRADGAFYLGEFCLQLSTHRPQLR